MEHSKQYFATTFTTSGAMKFNRFLRNNKITAEVKPTPRAISTSCAVGVEFHYSGDLNMLIIKDVRQIYAVQGNQYILKYARSR